MKKKDRKSLRKNKQRSLKKYNITGGAATENKKFPKGTYLEAAGSLEKKLKQIDGLLIKEDGHLSYDMTDDQRLMNDLAANNWLDIKEIKEKVIT